MDVASLLGLLLALAGILVGHTLDGGKFSSLVQPAAFLIVVVGTFGAVLLQTKKSAFIRGMRMLRWVFAPPLYPRSIYLIDTLLLITALGAFRDARRAWRESWPQGHAKKVLVVGAGDAGEMIVRDMRHNPRHEYEPVGLVDDDPSKRGEQIHGVPVLGGRAELARIMRPQLQPVSCSNCGKFGHATNAKFCDRCGHDLHL